jgi:hypothetical protein
MALSVAQGSGAWLSTDVATTTYTISGLSFQPKAIILWTNGLNSATDTTSTTTNQAQCMGFAASTSDRCCNGVLGVDNSAAADTQAILRNDAVLAFPTSGAAVDGLLDLNSITSDGFTLIVDDALSFSVRYFWFAIGGSDVTNVGTGEITEPGATGNVSYTVGAGFQPTVAFFSGTQLTSASNTVAAVDSGFMFGAATATGDGNQFVNVGNSDEGSANMDVDSYMPFVECVAMITSAGGNPNVRAQFNGFDSVGFDLNWVARASTRRVIYLALAAGSNVKCGKIALERTNGTTAAVSGLAFQPDGGMASQQTVQSGDFTAGIAHTDNEMSIGAFVGTGSQMAMSVQDLDAAANADITLGISYDEILTETLNNLEVSVSAIASDGFTVKADTGSASTGVRNLGYVIFGNAVVTSDTQEWRGCYPMARLNSNPSTMYSPCR